MSAQETAVSFLQSSWRLPLSSRCSACGGRVARTPWRSDQRFFGICRKSSMADRCSTIVLSVRRVSLTSQTARKQQVLAQDLTAILNCFDTVGMYVRRGVLEWQVIGLAFNYSLENCRELLEDDVTSLEHQVGATCWKQACWLYARISSFERGTRRRQSRDTRQARTSVRKVLVEERERCAR
jgi:hypothetical protein